MARAGVCRQYTRDLMKHVCHACVARTFGRSKRSHARVGRIGAQDIDARHLGGGMKEGQNQPPMGGDEGS